MELTNQPGTGPDSGPDSDGSHAGSFEQRGGLVPAFVGGAGAGEGIGMQVSCCVLLLSADSLSRRKGKRERERESMKPEQTNPTLTVCKRPMVPGAWWQPLYTSIWVDPRSQASGCIDVALIIVLV